MPAGTSVLDADVLDVAPPPADCMQLGAIALASGPLNAFRLALDSSYVYWTSAGTGTTPGAVMKVSKCGGDPITLATVEGGAYAIAVDSTSVYWADFFGLQKVPLDGGAQATLAKGAPYINTDAITLGGTTLYWDDDEQHLFGTPVSGGTTVLVTSPTAPFLPSGMSVDATSVYWVGGGVFKAPRAGGPPTLLTSAMRTDAIAVDATSVYWTNRDAVNYGTLPNTGSVMKVSLGGGTAVTLGTGQNITVTSGVAVDGMSVYWTADSTIMKVSLDGGSPITLATDQGVAQSIALDDTSVFWVDDNGMVRKLTPK